jgi:hypothetical protein
MGTTAEEARWPCPFSSGMGHLRPKDVHGYVEQPILAPRDQVLFAAQPCTEGLRDEQGPAQSGKASPQNAR